MGSRADIVAWCGVVVEAVVVWAKSVGWMCLILIFFLVITVIRYLGLLELRFM